MAILTVVLLLGTVIPVSASAVTGTDTVSVADYNGKKVGVLTGTVHDEYARKYLPDSEIVYFSTVSDMAVAVMTGVIDCFSMDILTVKNLMMENSELSYVDEPLDSISTAIAFPKTEDGGKLRDEMNEKRACTSPTRTTLCRWCCA